MKKNLIKYCLLVGCAIFLWITNLQAQPDLTLQNFQPEVFGEAGTVTTYALDLQNIGTETAEGEYTIGAYISADSIWNETDSLAGIIPTGNTPVGTITTVPGAITVPDLPAGDYYLILVLDIYNEIAESNEENNQAVIAYLIENEAVSESDDCEIALGVGEIICHQALADGTFEAYKLHDQQLTRLVFSATGELLSSEEQERFQLDSLIVRDGEVIKKLANDSVVWRREIPAEVMEIAPNVSKVAELANGDFVFASFAKGNPYPFANDSLQLIRTDAALQILTDTIVFRNTYYNNYDELKDIRANTDGTFTLVYISTTLYQTLESILNIVKFDTDFTILDDFMDWGSVGQFLRTPCGDFRIKMQDDYSSGNGRVSGNESFVFNFNSIIFQRQNEWSFRQSTGMGGPSTTVIFNSDRTDERLSVNYGNRDLELSLPSSLTLTFGRDENAVNIEIDAVPFKYLIRTNNQTAVIFYENDNQLYVTSSTCIAIPQLNDLDLQIVVEDSLFHQYADIAIQLRVQNHSPEIVDNIVVALPLPEGLVHSGQSSTQGDYVPFTGEWAIGTLAANSTAVIDLKLFPLVNQPLEVFAQITSADIDDVDSTPANGNCCVAMEDDEAVVRLLPYANLQNDGANQGLVRANSFYKTDAFRLSPTVVNESFELYFQSKSTAVTVCVFDAQGQPVLTKKMDAVDGLNRARMDVNHLPSGLYFVQLTGTQAGRTLKFVKQQ